MIIVHRTEIDIDGIVQRFILHSDDKLSLQNIDYHLDRNPHENRIIEVEDGFEMPVSPDEMRKIINGGVDEDSE